MIDVREIAIDSDDYQKGLEVRRIVFVIGQNVPEEDEVDQFEKSSNHFIASIDDKVVGAARWRDTGDYIKLERFAVLDEYRGKGIGSALVDKVMQSIRSKHAPGTRLLLHSQIPAISLYARFNFIEKGEIFEECGILHRTMVRQL